METREDFTEKDNPSVFPMYVDNPASNYGFCPGKATWDPMAASIFKGLIITAYTGRLEAEGGIDDQDQDYIDILSWFLPAYDEIKFYSRAQAILGDGKKGTGGVQPLKESPDMMASKGQPMRRKL